MFCLSESDTFYLYPYPTDMRKSFYSLSGIVTNEMKHAYQIMANELMMPHLVVSGIYMGLQAVCCVWYIACPGYLTLFLEAGILVTMYMVFMKKYYHLHVRKDHES